MLAGMLIFFFYRHVYHQVITKGITDVMCYQCVVADVGPSVARFLALNGEMTGTSFNIEARVNIG